MSIREIVYAGVLLILVGVLFGSNFPTTSVNAQAVNDAAPWELLHHRYGNESFYAIKFRPDTGETWVLDARTGSKDDRWVRLPEDDLTTR